MLMMMLDINPYIIGTFFCLCVIVIYRYMRETYSVIQKLGIPCPKPVWVFGNTHEMKDKDPLIVFQEWRKQYGDVYGFYEGFKAGVVVHGPEMANEILSKNFDSFYTRSSYRPFQYYPTDKMLVNLDGIHWRTQRAVMNKALNYTGTLKQLIEKCQIVSKDMLQELEQERQLHPEGVDVQPLVQKYTSHSMMRFLLDMGEDDMRCYGDTLLEYEIESSKSSSARDNPLVGLALLFPTLTPLLQLSDKTHKKCHEKVVTILRTYIANNVEGQNNNDMKSSDHSSILSYLLSSTVQSRDIDGSLTRRQMTSEEILAHVLSLLSETYSTTSATLSFMLYELARNPTVQENLYEEICQVCTQNCDALQSMKYFDMVFNETYRLHPVAPGVSRECNTDCTVKGYHFKRGFTVRVMTSSMYNDPALFPNPEQFNPERFSEDDTARRPLHSFLPFGHGPRMCPGQKLAMIGTKMNVISILTRFRLEISDRTEIPIKHALRPSIVPANGVHLKLVPRS